MGNASPSHGFLRSLFADTTKSIVSAVLISVLFFVWSDYVDKQPNLNGTWYFTATTNETSYSKVKGLKVTYQVSLLQDGLKLSGNGEKVSDELNGVITGYTGKDRVQIGVNAAIRHNYLSRDTLNLEYSEAGTARTSSTFMRLVRYSDDFMSGDFSSTAANTKGIVEWRRTPNSGT